MNPNKELECPCCGERFSLEKAAYNVCLDCGSITPPGEDKRELHPDCRYIPSSKSEGREAKHNMGIRVYSQEAAEAKQKEVRNDE